MRASPSSVKRKRKCLRQWAFRYCCNLPQIDAEHFQFGKRLHKHAEQWLDDGTAPPTETKEGRLFFEGIPHLPRPGEAETELHVAIWLDAELNVLGALIGEGPLPDAPYVFFGYIDFLDGPILGDHKTFGNPRWVLTPEELEQDEAAVIYSAAVAEGRSEPEILLKWVYYSKQRPKAFPIEGLISREDSLIKLKTLAPDLDEMQAIRAMFKDGEDAIATANEVPNTPSACDSVGRYCDYWHHCRIFEVPKENVVSEANDRIAALKAKIAASKNAANAPEAQKQTEEVAKEVCKAPQGDASPASAAAEPEPAELEVKAEKGKRGPNKPKVSEVSDAVAGGAAVGSALGSLLSNGQKIRIEISLVA